MNRRRVTFLLCLGTFLFRASPAKSEEHCSASSTQEASRGRAADAFDEGQRLFSQGHFQRATERFQCSYRLYPHEATLFNLGESAEASGEVELAARTFHRYLERYPEAEGYAEVQQRVQNLEERLDSTSPADSVQEPEIESALEGRPHLEPDTDTDPDPDPELDAPREELELTVETQMTGARRGAWASLALCLATGIGGGVLYGTARSQNSDYLQERSDFEQGSSGGLDADQLDSMAQRGRGLEAGGWALMGIGAASLAASVILFTVFTGEEPSAPASRSRAFLSPLLGGGGQRGLSVGGTF